MEERLKSGVPLLHRANILHHRKAYGPASLPCSVALARSLPLSFEVTILITALGRYADNSHSTRDSKDMFQQRAFYL